MKRPGILVLAFLGLVLTTGCPFESDVPLGSPGPGSLDPQLRGRWVAVDADNTLVEIDFLPFNEGEYLVELREKDKKLERYRAYTVRISGEPFLNLNEVKDDTARHSFYFARYSLDRDGVLALRFVGDKAVPRALGTDQKGLEGFLAAHLDDVSLDDSKAPIILHRSSGSPDGAADVLPEPSPKSVYRRTGNSRGL